MNFFHDFNLDAALFADNLMTSLSRDEQPIPNETNNNIVGKKEENETKEHHSTRETTH